MSDAAAHTETLWITDAELIRRSGVPEKKMRLILRALDGDRRSGFPRKNPLWDNRRYWPDVVDYWRKAEKKRAESAMTRPLVIAGGRDV